MSLSSIYRPNEDISNPSLESVMDKLQTFNPEQLKAFAAANQDDMILLGAAQAVHANHEKFAQAKMAQQGGQMPPVNQQVVQNIGPTPPQGMPPQGGQGMPPQGMPPQGMPPQGMPPQGGGPLPEQQGIAQLPTPNIDNMAGGGIVAFADGGSADEDMMYSGEPVLRMADGGHIPRYQGVPLAMGGDGNFVMDPNEFAGIDEQIAARKRQMELESAFDDYSKPVPKASPKASPKANAVQPTAGVTKPEDYKQLMGSFMPQKSVDPLAKERAEVSAAKTKLAQENYADYNADMEKLGIAGKPQEERINKREAELGKQKDLNTNMAIIEAGLAMMQSRGRGLAGIAEGAGVGTKMYASGIERLRAAQEKIDDARDGLDTLRRNEAFMTTRDRRALKTDIGKTVLGAKEDMFKGAEQAYNLDRGDAGKYFDAAMKAQEGGQDRASRERVATIGANALTARANAANSPEDKQAALMVKVQNALSADPEYKEASKFAKYKGEIGDAARAKILERKQEIYRLLAPELLESLNAGKANPLAGSGSGVPLAPISSFYMKPK
jgi:hypothetical protein